ncbi:MAG: ABC transporter permease, partial [Lachnospiraceae bacterium]|nr:ABC transporter permease [Lachnospiraceae bacterium]
MNKEPFFRMSSRESISLWKEILIYVVAILLALVACAGVIYALVQMNPIDVYKAIFDGALGTKRRIWITVRDTLTLLCIAVGLAPAFKMRFWNIGAEGQILVGGVAAAALMINLADRIPNVLLILLMFVAAAAAGMIWGRSPAFFKAHGQTN